MCSFVYILVDDCNKNSWPLAKSRRKSLAGLGMGREDFLGVGGRVKFIRESRGLGEQKDRTNGRDAAKER